MQLTTTAPTTADRLIALGMCLAAFSAGFVALAFAGGSPERRRPRFALRLVCGAVVLPGLAGLAVEGTELGIFPRGAEPMVVLTLLGFGVPGLLLFGPALLYGESPGPPPGEEDGGGGGTGPRRPYTPPRRPRGGIPLPDADPARVRLRDHGRPRWGELPVRRPAHVPRPARTPARHP